LPQHPNLAPLRERVWAAARAGAARFGLTIRVVHDGETFAGMRRRVHASPVHPAVDPARTGEGDILGVVLIDSMGNPAGTVAGRRYSGVSAEDLLRSGLLWGPAPYAVPLVLERPEPVLQVPLAVQAFLAGMAVADAYQKNGLGVILTHVLRLEVLGAWAADLLWALHQPDKRRAGMVTGHFAYAGQVSCHYCEHGFPDRPDHADEVIGWTTPDHAAPMAEVWLACQQMAASAS
jgi:uncharacterized RDD family membrane protein YckC